METAKASYIETNCTVEFNGKTFEAGGAVVTDKFITAYLGKAGILQDWHGARIGAYRILSTWRTPRSYVSSTMNSVECFVNGVRYVGRSAGVGMVINAKPSKRQHGSGKWWA
jgi:hypothetical protein